MNHNQDPHRYDDLLNLPHHQSKVHPPMKPQDRAAQFSPYAALVGYGEQIKEAARLTHHKITLSENDQQRLDEKLQILMMQIGTSPSPRIQVTYFEKDALKEGGEYKNICGHPKKIDPVTRMLIFFDENGTLSGQSIPIDDILEIDGELFQPYEFV